MKIEFRKVPFKAKEFLYENDSVKFEGTFCRISPQLIDVKANLSGKTEVECGRCVKSFEINLDENLEFLLSDGVYTLEDERDIDNIIIEISNHIIDFEELVQSELSSIKSDYHICPECDSSDNSFEQEF
jgi:uncharacterized metal-binding protein YceD (DUF177 family)